MENTVKELKKLIYSFGAAYKPSDVFRDFVELAAIAILNSYIRDEDWENREERYHVIRRQYKEEAFKIFPELLGVLASGCIRAVKVGNYEDFLGELYMDLGASNERNGQFFTPMSISRVMAKLAGIDTVEKLANKRFVSLLEPCCGSGANLLAFAEHIADSGKIPSLHMAAVAVDIDVLCVWMCFVQCHFYGIPAKIIHGDSLKLEFHTAWRTVHWLRGGFEDDMKAEIVADKKAAFDAEQQHHRETKITAPLLTLEEQLILF